MTKRSPWKLLAGLAALFASGCATTPSHPPAGAAAPVTTPAASLARGASSAAVIQALGQPDRIEAVKANPAAAIWTYHRPIETKVRSVEATMQETVVFDPHNRETSMRVVQEPVQHTQQVVVEEVLVLIMVHNRLSDWRRSYREVAATGITR